MNSSSTGSSDQAPVKKTGGILKNDGSSDSTVTLTLSQDDLQAAGRPAGRRRVSFFGQAHVRPISRRKSSIVGESASGQAADKPKLQFEIPDLSSGRRVSGGTSFGLTLGDGEPSGSEEQSMQISDQSSFDQDSFEVPIKGPDLPSTPMAPSPMIRYNDNNVSNSPSLDMSLASPTGSELDAIQQSFLAMIPTPQQPPAMADTDDNSAMDMTNCTTASILPQSAQKPASENHDEEGVDMDTTVCDGMILDALDSETATDMIPPTPMPLLASDKAVHMEMTMCVGGINSNNSSTVTNQTNEKIAQKSAHKPQQAPHERAGFAQNCRKRLSFARARLSMASAVDMDMTQCHGDILSPQETGSVSAPGAPRPQDDVSLTPSKIGHVAGELCELPIASTVTSKSSARDKKPAISSRAATPEPKSPSKNSTAHSPARRSPRLSSSSSSPKLKSPVKVKSPVKSPKKTSRKSLPRSSSAPQVLVSQDEATAGPEPVEKASLPKSNSMPSSPVSRNQTPEKRVACNGTPPPVARTPGRSGGSHKRSRLHISFTAEELTAIDSVIQGGKQQQEADNGQEMNVHHPVSPTPSPRRSRRFSIAPKPEEAASASSTPQRKVKEFVEDESFSEMCADGEISLEHAAVTADLTSKSGHDGEFDDFMALPGDKDQVSTKQSFSDIMDELKIQFLIDEGADILRGMVEPCELDKACVLELEFFRKAVDEMEEMIRRNETYVQELEQQIEQNFWNLVTVVGQVGNTPAQDLAMFKEMMSAAKVLVDGQVQQEWTEWHLQRVQPYSRDIFMRLQMLEGELAEVMQQKRETIPDVGPLAESLAEQERLLAEATERMAILQRDGPQAKELLQREAADSERIEWLRKQIEALEVEIPQVEQEQQALAGRYLELEKQATELQQATAANTADQQKCPADAVELAERARRRYTTVERMFLWSVLNVSGLRVELAWRSSLRLVVKLDNNAKGCRLDTVVHLSMDSTVPGSRTLEKIANAYNVWFGQCLSAICVRDLPRIAVSLEVMAPWLQQIDCMHAACPIDFQVTGTEDGGCCMLQARSQYVEPSVCAFWNGVLFSASTA